MELLHKNITASILQSFFNVAKVLPFGLDKSFYINALTNDIQQANFSVQTNKLVDIFYNDNVIGQLNFDIIVNDAVIIKVDTSFDFINNQQLEKNKIYLKLSHYEVLLLLNFGQEADYKRLFLSNDYKQLQQSRGSGSNGLLP
jgi:GxxExxY protein